MDPLQQFAAIQDARIRREAELYSAQVAMPHLLSADATFSALHDAVEELSRSAPADHDVLIHAFGITVTDVRYIVPHTFVFRGFDESGNHTFVTCHFTQLVARVSYLPKRGQSRIITGFST